MGDVTETEVGQALPVRLVKLPGGVPNLDADLEARVAGMTPGEILRIRLPLLMYSAKSQNFPGLRHNSWLLEFQSAADVSGFRDALGEFIKGWVEQRQGESQR